MILTEFVRSQTWFDMGIELGKLPYPISINFTPENEQGEPEFCIMIYDDVTIARQVAQGVHRTFSIALAHALRMAESWTMTRKEVYDVLKTLGYEVRLANGDCFDIDVDGFTHYLSMDEATALVNMKASHPVDISDYIVGRYPWLTYSFPEMEVAVP